MRESLHHTFLKGWLLAPTLAIALTCFAFKQNVTPELSRCPNGIYEAQSFLQALYPETQDKRYSVLFSVGGTYDVKWTRLPRLEVNILDTDFTPSVQLFMGKEGEKNNPLYPLITAYFDFDTESQLEGVSISGESLVNAARNSQISQSVNAHRNWTDSQIARALKDAAAKYGPEDKSKFIRALPLRELTPFLGPLTIKSVEFQMRHGQTGGALAELFWVVEGVASRTNGQLHNYMLCFEPFDGKLTSLRRIPQGDSAAVPNARTACMN
jgi:hypothetical protein